MERKFHITAFNQSENVVSFSWVDLGGRYQVYRNNQHVYESTVASFSDGLVRAGETVEYAIERVIDNKVVDVIRIQQITKSEDGKRHPLHAFSFTTIVQAEQVRLRWEGVKGVHTYDVYRNDELKALTHTQFIDHEPSEHYPVDYRLEFHRPLKQTHKKFGTGRSLMSNALIYSARRKARQKATEQFTFVKQVAPLNQMLLPMEKRIRQNAEVCKLRYTTFIADSTIDNLNQVTKYQRFKGDNRSFHPEGKHFRTRVDIHYDVKHPHRPLLCKRSIGETISTSQRGKVRGRGFADESGIEVEKVIDGLEETVVCLTHAVENPLVIAPKISYDVFLKAYVNETFDISGAHNDAPDHEVYIAFDDEDWQPVHLARSKGLIWLIDVMGSQYWRYIHFR